MSQPVIQVENLSKAYRIGLKEEIPDTLMGAATGWLKAPLRNWRRLRKLNTFTEGRESRVESREQEEDRGQRTEVSSQEADNPQASSGLQPSTLDPRPSSDSEQGGLVPPDHTSDIIWALKDVNFNVNEGEVVGIIGRNGAGKSTLLKILSRITEPTSGRAIIRGRVSSLLEVGTGFHPELTGRENIYMNGTILGMRKKEIDRKFDEIVDFSGVEKFLDTPTKRYSSGMQVRLAFAVAAHLEPEILIIDEVLAVGDAEFQRKCLGKMQDVAAGGRTVLFVSHNMAAVQSLCSTALWIQSGRLRMHDQVNAITQEYVNDISVRPSARRNRQPSDTKNCWISSAEPVAGSFLCGAPIEFSVTLDGITASFGNGWLCAIISNDMGTEIVQCDSRLVEMTFQSGEFPFTSRLVLQTPWLRPGRYRLDVHAVADGILDSLEGACYFDVHAPYPYAVDGTASATKRGIVCGDFSWRHCQSTHPRAGQLNR